MNPPKKYFPDIYKYGPWEGQEKFSDSCLQTEDGSVFQIHRVILSRSSKYFRGLFSFDGNLKENVLICGIDSKILDLVLMFIYTGNASLDQENIWDIMIASDYLLVEDLLQECRSYAVRKLTPSNCMSAVAMAWKIEKLSLFNDCFRYAIVHFGEIIQASAADIGKLPLEILKKLLKSNSLNVTSERTVWMAITKWVESNRHERLHSVPELIVHIRMEDGMSEALATEILSHEIVKSNHFCDDLNLSKLFNHFFLNSTVLLDFASYRRTHGQSSTSGPRLPEHLHFVARHCVSQNKLGSELYLTYDEKLDFWRHVGDVHFFAEVIVRLGEHLYLFNTWDNTSIIFDVTSEMWTQMAPLVSPRYSYSVVILGEYIFAVGGLTDGYEYTDIIECYDPNLDFWSPVRPMIEMIVSEAVSFDGQIYVIGHTFTEDAPAMMCQVYNTASDTWTSVSSPKVLRRGFSLVAFGASLYVIGGECDDGYLRIVEEYQPSKDVWGSLPDMPFAYFTPKAVVVEGMIVVYDNNHEDTRFCTISPPVYLNTVDRIWEVIDKSSLLYGIERYTFCTLDDRVIVEHQTAKNRHPGITWDRRYFN